MLLRVRRGPLPRDSRDRGGLRCGPTAGCRGCDARILDLTHLLWAAVFEVGDDAEVDEESAVCNTLECGLTWARRAFDELILPATSVSSLCTVTRL
jgi:hypothetical protein